ncbi:MAG: iron-containing alcohol dehydrogenase [Pseudomonadota bacterium]
MASVLCTRCQHAELLPFAAYSWGTSTVLNQLKNALIFFLAKILTARTPGVNYHAYAGAGSAAQLCAHIRRSGFKRVLVVTDKPLRELGLVDKALAGLADTGIDIDYYDGVLPDPTFTQVAEGLAIQRRHGSDAVLAIGGGSPIDCGKIIAAAATSAEDPKDWIGFAKIKHDALPIFVIPTTAGTGSEATRGAVITDEVTHEKNVLSGATLSPVACALDPELQMGLPKSITAATGMDALTHAVEAYICRWENGSSRTEARRAIKLIYENLETAYNHGDNADAREAMIMGAYYAGIAINQVNVGTVHAIAHQLGGKYGIVHGVANAMALPHVLDFHRPNAETLLAELAQLIGVAEVGASADQQAKAFIRAIDELRAAVGIEAASDQIKSEDFDYLSDRAVNEAIGYFAPRLLTDAAAREILGKISA